LANTISKRVDKGVKGQGTIKFMGMVQSISNSSITVGMPDGQRLSMNIVSGQTYQQSLKSIQPSVGQLVGVTAIVNPDGSFTASELDLPKPETPPEQNTVKYVGITTSAVGANNMLTLKVGNKSFSFPIGTGADLKDFNSNAHAIGNNVTVKAEVVFNGTKGTVVSVENKQGTIEFIGMVQSISNSSITVCMPDGQGLSMNMVNGQIHRQSLKSVQKSIQPSVGQLVRVTAIVNPDGSFTASELDLPKPEAPPEQNTVKYVGVTTSAVGANNMLTLKVGNKSFSFPIGTGADLKDFNSNAHAIGNNVTVKAEVVFTGTKGTVVSVENEGT